MDKKDIIIIVIKVIVYACSLVLGVLGVTSLASCSVQRDTTIAGKATIVTNDTTYIYHNGVMRYPKK